MLYTLLATNILISDLRISHYKYSSQRNALMHIHVNFALKFQGILELLDAPYGPLSTRLTSKTRTLLYLFRCFCLFHTISNPISWTARVSTCSLLKPTCFVFCNYHFGETSFAKCSRNIVLLNPRDAFQFLSYLIFQEYPIVVTPNPTNSCDVYSLSLYVSVTYALPTSFPCLPISC